MDTHKHTNTRARTSTLKHTHIYTHIHKLSIKPLTAADRKGTKDTERGAEGIEAETNREGGEERGRD